MNHDDQGGEQVGHERIGAVGRPEQAGVEGNLQDDEFHRPTRVHGNPHRGGFTRAEPCPASG
jgi:hypothetical protein